MIFHIYFKQLFMILLNVSKPCSCSGERLLWACLLFSSLKFKVTFTDFVQLFSRLLHVSTVAFVWKVFLLAELQFPEKRFYFGCKCVSLTGGQTASTPTLCTTESWSIFQKHSRKCCLYPAWLCCEPVDPFIDSKSVGFCGVNVQPCSSSVYRRGGQQGANLSEKER